MGRNPSVRTARSGLDWLRKREVILGWVMVGSVCSRWSRLSKAGLGAFRIQNM
jgi:hypothetical protein